ncbi:alpha/beta hydrolase [Roseateles amylovorans]|uniref:Alpha/beta hydrolase n=1 Tax=Roseateles amylovorans TaxID=2978473 RepID=A0ABY6B7K0_9BURK|nr:alpha/beta hydrolase [Roseateles amylovorans]UXH80931.1 alpha/beta hydrolase [Roseateles amylovorans]
MAAVLERIHRANRPSFASLSPKQARIAYLMGAEILDLPRAPLARIENLRIPGPAQELPARLYAPTLRDDGAPLPVLLYFHGGGFVIGSLETHDSLCRQLALRSGAAVIAVDYRLAPEHPFPAAVDDAWAALRWVAAEAASLGLDGRRLAVGGDSAGGTLAAVTALHARDIRSELGLDLALQLLITPGATAHADTDSHRRFAQGHLLDADTIAWFFNQYIPTERRDDWRFAPLLAQDHGDLAPACLILAEADPLIDEGLAYADLLRANGNAVQLELYRGVTHDFIKMGRSIPEAELALDACAAALQRAFQPDTTAA